MTAVSAQYIFAPDEQPSYDGAPYLPRHSTRRKFGYAAITLLLSLTATLGNALVAVNIPNLAGSLGVYVAQASLLPAAYVAMNGAANLVLFKARARFGNPPVSGVLLSSYIGANILQLAVPGFGAALFVRAVSGICSAGLISLALFYLLEILPPRLRILAPVGGMSVVQLSFPLARMVPVEMLALNNWRGLHLIELGLAFAAVAATIALPLPPSRRARPIFQWLDFVTFGLFAPALFLVCVVIVEGRFLWWTDAPWLGTALIVAVPMLVAAGVIEYLRAQPLIHIRWLGTLDIVRLALIAILIRLALAEQNYGSVGLLTAAGLTNDQLRVLFGVVVSAVIAGGTIAMTTITVRRLPWLIFCAALAIAAGAGLDSMSNNLTRPSELYLSQALIGFGTTLFIGPALAYGFGQSLMRGPDHLVTLFVMFSVSQNVGGLAGSSILGSYQIYSARHHALALAEATRPDNPLVVERLQTGARLLSGTVSDPTAQAAQGSVLLGQALNREASVLAFNDVFFAVSILALATAAYMAYIIAFNTIRRRRAAVTAAAQAAA